MAKDRLPSKLLSSNIFIYDMVRNNAREAAKMVGVNNIENPKNEDCKKTG
ncbi:hypothetical protein [Brevibacillus daliensis]|nr:hypothetical protein [Brevibacillus daliensis]